MQYIKQGLAELVGLSSSGAVFAYLKESVVLEEYSLLRVQFTVPKEFDTSAYSNSVSPSAPGVFLTFLEPSLAAKVALPLMITAAAVFCFGLFMLAELPLSRTPNRRPVQQVARESNEHYARMNSANDVLAETDREECKICFTNKQAVAYQCGHMVCCFHCNKMIRERPAQDRKCPVCRELIIYELPIYAA